MHRQADGSLLCEGFPLRECVMPYLQPDGSVLWEYVPASTIAQVAADIGRIPVTLHHPPEGVTPANFGRYGVGDVDGRPELVGATPKEWEAKGGFVRVGFAVRRGDAIDAIDRGEVTELSLGYECTAIRQSGTYNGQHYDSVQVGRVHNHLALVDAARVGPDARFRADAAIAQHVLVAPTAPGLPSSGSPATTTTPPREAREDHMKPLAVQLLALLGVTHVDNEDAALREGIEKARALATARDAATTACTEMEQEKEQAMADKTASDAKVATLTTERDTARGEATALKARVDAFEKAAKDAADAEEAKVLLPHAARLQVDGADKMALPALQAAIAKAALGDKLKADASPVEIAAIARTVAATAPATRADAWQPVQVPGAERTDGAPKSRAQRFLDKSKARYDAARTNTPTHRGDA